jgi:hypothetical protein
MKINLILFKKLINMIILKQSNLKFTNRKLYNQSNHLNLNYNNK